METYCEVALTELCRTKFDPEDWGYEAARALAQMVLDAYRGQRDFVRSVEKNLGLDAVAQAGYGRRARDLRTLVRANPNAMAILKERGESLD